MKKLLLLVLFPILAYSQATTQYHRVGQVFSRAPQSVSAQVVPNATVTVTVTATGIGATIYSDPALSNLISPPIVTTDSKGNYDYFIPLNYCVNEQVSSPGQGSYSTTNICSNNAGPTGPVGPVGPVGPIGPVGPPGAGNIIASPQFTMMFQPLVGIQSAAQGDPGITSDGSGSLQARTGFGSRIASQWQTPPLAGNNGIANSFVSPGTSVADPSYAQTENYSSANGTVVHTPNSTLSHLIDYRGGQQTDYYMDPAINAMPWSNWHTGHTDVCTYTTPGAAYTGGLGNPRYGMACNLELGWYTGPGISLGASGINNPIGWHVPVLHQYQLVSNTPGISEIWSSNQTKSGAGDNTGFYDYSYCYGGAIAGNDEGCEGFSANTGEANTTFTGTVATVTDETHFKATCTADCGLQGDGRYITKVAPLLTSFVTAHTAPSGNTPGNFTINDPVASASTFWGTLAANVVTPVSPSITAGTPMVFSVASGPGNTGAPVAGDLVCFQSQYHEQSRITNVSGTGPWTVTIPLRHSHASGTWMMANGPCGTFINFIANQSTGAVSLKYPLDIIGATDTTHLQYASFSYATGNSSWATHPGSVVLNTGSVSNLTNYSGLVTMTGLNANFNYLFNSPAITLTSASDAAFNGQCTNTKYDGVTLSCTQASSVGHLGPATATITAGTTGSGNGNFTLLVGAEVLDVQNYTTLPPVVDGTFMVEPNNMALGAGNLMEQHHHYSLSFQHEHSNQNVNGPVAQGVNQGYSLVLQGSGIIGGNLLNGAAGMAALYRNDTPLSTYANGGGIQPPFGGLYFGGFWDYMATMPTAPLPVGAALIYVGCPGTTAGCNDYAAQYYPLELSGQATSTGAAGGLSFRPASNELTLLGNVVITNPLGLTTVADNIRATIPVAPTPTFTQFATNGTLGAGTYCYRIAVRNTAAGQAGVPGTEACSTFAGGTTNSLLVKWTRVAGAQSYNVYGRTGGAELQMAASVALNTPTFLDNGSVTPAGAMAVTDTTLPQLDNFASLNLNSAGTAFKATFKAPASVAGNYTVTGPETATTGSLVDKLAGATVVGDIATFSNVTGRIQDSATLLTSLAPKASPTLTGTTTVTTLATATNCAVNSVSPAACGSAAAGAVVIPTTTTTYTVNTSAVTAASRIMLFPMSFAGNLPSAPTCVAPAITSSATVSAISAGVSFTIALPSTTGQTCWMYLLVN